MQIGFCAQEVKEGCIVVHPTFGVGVVTEVLGDNKAEVMFRDDFKIVEVVKRDEPSASS